MLSLFKKLYWRVILPRIVYRGDLSRLAKEMGVHIGNDCRLLEWPHLAFGSEPWLISLGNHCTVCEGVRFITHDGGVWVFRHEHPDIDVFGPIKVGSNVFIGLGSILMPSITIGDNVIIGAGSVVTRDIPANSVAAGVPAKVITTIEGYKSKALSKASFIRSKTSEEKRQILSQKYGLPTA